jgi:hypothetical protein
VHRNRHYRRIEVESRKQRPSHKRDEINFRDIASEWRHKENIMLLGGYSLLDIEIERNKFFGIK